MDEHSSQLEVELPAENNKTPYLAAVWAAMGIGGAVLGSMIYNLLSEEKDISPKENLSSPITPHLDENKKINISK